MVDPVKGSELVELIDNPQWDYLIMDLQTMRTKKAEELLLAVTGSEPVQKVYTLGGAVLGMDQLLKCMERSRDKAEEHRKKSRIART